MIEYAALAALAAFTLIGPPIKRGGNHAHHNPLMVWLPTDETTLAQANHPEGRYAQEVGEWRFAGLVGLIPAIAAVVLLDGAIGVLAAFLAHFVGKALAYRLPFFDNAGHGAEIMVALADGWSSYRTEEIERMLRDPKRAGLTFQDVSEQLDRVAWLSRIMVRLAW